MTLLWLNKEQEESKFLSDELFNESNLEKINIFIRFKWFWAGNVTSIIRYTSWSLAWEKEIVTTNLWKMIYEIEKFVKTLSK